MSGPDLQEPPTRQRNDVAPSPKPRPPERLQLHVDDAELKPRSNASTIVLALSLCAVAGGLGYACWMLYQEQQRSAAGRAAMHTVQATLTSERGRAREQIAALEQLKTEQAQRIAQNDAELLELKATLAAAQARLEQVEAERAELSVQMAEYRQVTQQFRSMIDSGKLSVTFRRGRMIVELPAAVLFASGSAELSAQGSTALREVAAILRNVPGKRFIVAGHTDNVPISKAATGFSSNWALSAARAVIVTEALLSARLPPTHVVAAGYGEYDPIAPNSETAGRQKNRRIEIVLEPELKAFPSPAKDPAKN